MYRTIFDRIQSEDRALFDFLLQLSILRSPVPGPIFHDYYLATQENRGTLPSYYKLFIDDGQWSPERFLGTIMRISAYGMINKKLEDGSEMLIGMNHNSILDFLQGEVARDKTHHLQLSFHATAIVAASLSLRNWELLSLHYRNLLYSHVEFCFENRRSVLTTPAQIKEYGGVLEGYQTTLAAFLACHGKREVAKDLLWQSLNLQSTWLAERAGLTCTTLECLILVHLEDVDLSDAETLINRLTAIESRIHPKKRQLYLNILLLKGHLQTRKQNLEYAISAFKECTELSAHISGASYTTAADSLASGAEVLLMQGNSEEATQNIYDAASLVELAGGSPSVEFRVEWNLARLSSTMGDYVRAIRRYQQLIENCQKHYGSRYQRWSLLHCELGDVYRELGDMQNTEYCYEVGRASTTRRARPLGTDANDISPWLGYETLMGKKRILVGQ